jgi:hypothetical protein
MLEKLALCAPAHRPSRTHASFWSRKQELAMTRRQDNLIAPVMFFATWFGCFAMMVLHFGS